jgi:hypothetical protein
MADWSVENMNPDITPSGMLAYFQKKKKMQQTSNFN